MIWLGLRFMDGKGEGKVDGFEVGEVGEQGGGRNVQWRGIREEGNSIEMGTSVDF